MFIHIIRSIHKNSLLPRYSYIRILSCESATSSSNPTCVGYKRMCSVVVSKLSHTHTHTHTCTRAHTQSFRTFLCNLCQFYMAVVAFTEA